MVNRTDVFEEDGLVVGPVYSLVEGRDTELIPREKISYVSAKYQSQPLYIVLGLIAIIYGGVQLQPAPAPAGIAFVFGLVLIVAFFLTSKVGVVVASSGGRLFIQTRGRNRYELLEKIYADLAAHSADR